MTDTVEPKSQEWALANIPYFRRLGFFADLTEKSDAEVLAEIYHRYVDAEGLPYTKKGKSPPPWSIQLKPPLADLCLLQYDYSRAWWDDTECVYPPDILAYQDAFARWASISRGAFAPIEIEEKWGGTDEAPQAPSVRIRLPNGTLTLQPVFYSDWFDLTTQVPINSCIRPSGIRFELYEQFDQTAFVVAVKPSEKEELREVRHWKFHDFPDN